MESINKAVDNKECGIPKESFEWLRKTFGYPEVKPVGITREEFLSLIIEHINKKADLLRSLGHLTEKDKEDMRIDARNALIENVNSYTEDDLDIIDKAISDVQAE